MGIDLELRHGASAFEAELWPDGHIRVRLTFAYVYCGTNINFNHYTPGGHLAFLAALDVRRRDFRLVHISESMRELLGRYGFELGSYLQPPVPTHLPVPGAPPPN
jgi:hypothetical protein